MDQETTTTSAILGTLFHFHPETRGSKDFKYASLQIIDMQEFKQIVNSNKLYNNNK